MSLPAALRNAVWIKYIGNEKGSSVCSCCEYQQIDRGNYECGHVIARAKGGEDHIDNLRPICKLCNTSMGTKNMEEFKKLFKSSEIRRNDVQVCDTCHLTKTTDNFSGNRSHCISCIFMQQTEFYNIDKQIGEMERQIQTVKEAQAELEAKELMLKDILNKMNLNKQCFEKKILFMSQEKDVTNQFDKLNFDDEQTELSHLNKLTIAKLKQLCKYFNINYHLSFRKKDYIEVLKFKNKDDINKTIHENMTNENFIEAKCSHENGSNFTHGIFTGDKKIFTVGKQCFKCDGIITAVNIEKNEFYILNKK
jgi:hypothetical protein